MDTGSLLARSHTAGLKVSRIFQKRLEKAVAQFNERLGQSARNGGDAELARAVASMDPQEWSRYTMDAAQRAILYWATLHQRGDNFIEHTAEGLKPVLHFEYELVLDGRRFERPVNYALLRITPPEGVTVDDGRRPYVIIDPRAGHGPGIGGFKDDSQVGVALRAGHPVYFVIFFRDPEPGQTLLDVCEAERQFVREVRRRHPDSPKPALIGNCQGGWAAMMLAASHPDDTGPIVINGSPMSYWSGAWSEGEGDNPMRYAGGLLGGTWLSSLAADLGNGKFDGAYLVQNFENLNPANSLWDKYYHLYDKADTEPPRFLEFERWWGGYYLMNREEIEWITRNLFVGNKLWGGDVKSADGKVFDLRDIRSPIVLFASMGDNITPPQQAFNWVADVYKSTDEIKERGQVIVGLLHHDIGHLGIFVSGKVAKKEHSQIVSVLKSIEMLAPGLYAMVISERKDEAGRVAYDVEFREQELADIVARINRLGRIDEKPFEAVAAVSDFNQRAYELFARPLVQAMSNEFTAQLLREFHPLRMQNWMVSGLNPWLSWLQPAAEAVRASRQAVDEQHPLRQGEHVGAEMLSASLDFYRAVRDAATEAGFFGTYANLFGLFEAAKPAETHEEAAAPMPDARPGQDQLTQGGYTEAVARVAYLLTRKDEPLPLSRLEMRQELATDYADYLPEMPLEEWRRVRGEQEVIARHEPEEAVASLPALLGNGSNRVRLLELLDRLMSDRRVLGSAPTAGQRAMHARIRDVLQTPPPRARRRPASRARA
jgi:pimeloyl-ACP methyl ester carboxylesterase